MTVKARYPGIRVTANGNQLVAYHTATRVADAGVFYPITPSTEGGELFQQAYAEGHLNVFGITPSPSRLKASMRPRVVPSPTPSAASA